MGLENPLHIAVLVLILLLVFGAKRLPDLGRSLGSGIRQFRGSLEGAPAQPAPAISDVSSEPAAATLKTPH